MPGDIYCAGKRSVIKTAKPPPGFDDFAPQQGLLSRANGGICRIIIINFAFWVDE